MSTAPKTGRDIARMLRGERAGVLKAWQADVQTRLWHLDKALFARKGAATRCADATLEALVTLHQEPETALPLTEQAETWDALPVSWPDLCSLLERLLEQIRLAFAARDPDSQTWDIGASALIGLRAAIADRRIAQLEQQLAAQREETALNQHLAGRFVANASHELRTPLTAVLGFADLLLEETYGTLTAEQRTAVGHIENSAQNLLEIVNNLLDILQIRAGKLTLQYRSIAVAPLLHHVYTILIPLAERKKVEFIAELAGDLGAVEADENILRHVVYHLLASALRATPAGGKVTLQAERDAAHLIIITHDTALHLPPEAIANMMEPFPRLENSPARGYDGWEIGLPLVRRYVDLHGGLLELHSEPEKGTTFRVRIPVGRAAPRNNSA